MKRKLRQTEQVIWAVDPLDLETRPSNYAVQDWLKWLKNAGLGLKLVHILPASDAASVGEARRNLLRFAGDYSLPADTESEVLVSESTGKDSMVSRLLSLVAEHEAGWIMLSSHGRSGLGRAVFGSFAETLLEKSPIPVLFLGQNGYAAHPNGRLSALFPTDFSPHSRSAFRKFLPEAKKLKMDVIVFNLVTFPIWTDGVQAAPSNVPQYYFDEQIKSAKREAHAWIQTAGKAGVRASILVQDGRVGFLTGQHLLEVAAEAAVNLIVLASKSKPLERFLLGSAAYEAFRKNKFPICVYGPEALKRKSFAPALIRKITRKRSSISRSG